MRKLCVAWILFLIFLPYFGGIYYSMCGDRYVEQIWLDRAIRCLKVERIRYSRNPEMCEVLDYTIQNYNKIGAWNVMIMPLNGLQDKVIGCNLPYCPGITLDPEVMSYPIHEGAMMLVHESMHDGWFNCHPFIDAKMKRVGAM